MSSAIPITLFRPLITWYSLCWNASTAYVRPKARRLKQYVCVECCILVRLIIKLHMPITNLCISHCEAFSTSHELLEYHYSVRNDPPCSISAGDGSEALSGVARYASSAQLGSSFDAMALVIKSYFWSTNVGVSLIPTSDTMFF